MRSDERLEEAVSELCELIGSEGPQVANKAMRRVQKALDLDFAPVAAVQWVDIEHVTQNQYNPNQVAKNELKLLEISIDHDGMTQPVVTVWDEEHKRYIIVDGFHRYLVMKTSPKLRRRYHGLLPVVVIDKSPKERMASTVRHNRARGKHAVGGMGKLVMEMVKEGASDSEICNELGLEPDELVRLKHSTGVAALFKGREYSKSWKTVKQMRVENGEG